MIDKKYIVSLLLSLTQGQKKKFVKQTVHPHREWFIGLSLFVVVVTLGAVVSAYNFVRYTELEFTLVGQSQTVDMYKENTVKKALQIYIEKQNIFKQATEVYSPALTDEVPPALTPPTDEIAPDATSTPPTVEEEEPLLEVEVLSDESASVPEQTI